MLSIIPMNRDGLWDCDEKWTKVDDQVFFNPETRELRVADPEGYGFKIVLEAKQD